MARRAVTAQGGDIRVRNIPGAGCVFTIDLPLMLDTESASPGAAVEPPHHDVERVMSQPSR
jgi:hypothetical protein